MLDTVSKDRQKRKNGKVLPPEQGFTEPVFQHFTVRDGVTQDKLIANIHLVPVDLSYNSHRPPALKTIINPLELLIFFLYL
jgi:hypothetical protein